MTMKLQTVVHIYLVKQKPSRREYLSQTLQFALVQVDLNDDVPRLNSDIIDHGRTDYPMFVTIDTKFTNIYTHSLNSSEKDFAFIPHFPS